MLFFGSESCCTYVQTTCHFGQMTWANLPSHDMSFLYRHKTTCHFLYRRKMTCHFVQTTTANLYEKQHVIFCQKWQKRHVVRCRLQPSKMGLFDPFCNLTTRFTTRFKFNHSHTKMNYSKSKIARNAITKWFLTSLFTKKFRNHKIKIKKRDSGIFK